MSTDKISLSCAKCGSKDFKIPENPQPNDIVSCVGCGSESSYQDLQAKAIKEGKKMIEDLAKNLFK